MLSARFCYALPILVLLHKQFPTDYVPYHYFSPQVRSTDQQQHSPGANQKECVLAALLVHLWQQHLLTIILTIRIVHADHDLTCSRGSSRSS